MPSPQVGPIPGANLFNDAPDVRYPFILSLFLANLFLAVVGFAGLRYVAKVVLVPQGMIAAVVTGLAVIGAFSYRNLEFDIWIMAGLGLLGYILLKADFRLAPIILGIILGPMAEKKLDRVMILAQAKQQSVMAFFMGRGLTIGLMVLTFAAITYSFYRDYKWRKMEAQQAAE